MEWKCQEFSHYYPMYSDEEFELLLNDKLWFMCQTSQYGYLVFIL